MEYYHKNSDVVAFKRIEGLEGYYYEYTYDDKGNKLTYKDSYGYWSESTYDDKGNELTYKDSNDFGWESTYDNKGNELTFKNSEGYFRIKGKEVTEQEFENRSCVGKKIIIDGIEYQLN